MRKLAAVVGGMAVAAAAMADGDGSARTLKGRYALTGSAVCVISSATLGPVYIPPAGFTSTFVPVGHASSNSFSRNGVLTFNGDGTGTSASHVVVVSDPDSGDPTAVNSINSTSSFTYTVGDDGSFTLSEGTISSVSAVNGIPTQTINVAVLTGHVSKGNGTIVFGSYDPTVETMLRPDLGGIVSSQRICQRSTTAVRIDSDSDQ